jgi:ornithine carbamoyltransferase
LTMREYSSSEIWRILKISKQLKKEAETGRFRPLLKNKSLGMIFQKPSTRTRVSFEVAMRQLGGSALYLSWNELQLGRGETVADTARVLARYVDGIMARVFAHSDLEELAKYADVPVINGLSDLCHPVQILADLMTIWEKKGEFKGLKLAYIGDGNNVCNSLLLGCTKMGLNISVGCPGEYKPDERFVKWAEEEAKKSQATMEITTEPEQAARDADIVYTDVVVSMGQEAERAEREKIFLPKYRVTEQLFKTASKDAIFMHDLPAHRGEEVTNEVIDGPRSAVWDQAENRLHTTKGLLSLLI